MRDEISLTKFLQRVEGYKRTHKMHSFLPIFGLLISSAQAVSNTSAVRGAALSGLTNFEVIRSLCTIRLTISIKRDTKQRQSFTYNVIQLSKYSHTSCRIGFFRDNWVALRMRIRHSWKCLCHIANVRPARLKHGVWSPVLQSELLDCGDCDSEVLTYGRFEDFDFVR